VNWLAFVLLAFALLLFVLNAFGVVHEKVQLLPLGLAFAVVAFMVVRGLPP